MFRAEWLETNGLGGYASSTVSGINTRRYHGILVDGAHFPRDRTVRIAKADEAISLNCERYELGTNQFPDTVHPRGFLFLEAFEPSPAPCWRFHGPWGTLVKRLTMVHHEHTVIVEYLLEGATAPCTVEIHPLFTHRSYHALGANLDTLTPCIQDGEIVIASGGDSRIFVIIPEAAKWSAHREVHYSYEYLEEKLRGFEWREDLLSLGRLSLPLIPGETQRVAYALTSQRGRDLAAAVTGEHARRDALVTVANRITPASRSSTPTERVLFERLVRAADHFIVRRADNSLSMVAGYHWFNDWGRDAMIALTGCCWVTGRFSEGYEILKTFVSAAREGLIPNRFGEDAANGSEAGASEYNSVDASLWAFVATWEYLRATGRTEDLAPMLPTLRAIIDSFTGGTRFHIKCSPEEILSAGDSMTQLTWMDARVDGVPVTPREGAPVEINALWCNALTIYGELLGAVGDAEGDLFRDRAARCRHSFLQHFETPSGALGDSVSSRGLDTTVRPNQIFALSLPYPLLDSDHARTVLDLVTRELLTPVGLRTLSPLHPDYRPHYRGGVRERDGAYHQGSAWSWLLGPYLTALIHFNGERGRVRAREILERFAPHLNARGLGLVSELFDGAPPHTPRGCIAQAWGVGELLRAIAVLWRQEEKLSPRGEAP